VNFPAGTSYVAIAQIAARTPYWSVDNDLIFPNLENAFPSTPGNNSTAVFVNELANRAFLTVKGPSGLHARLQPFIGSNKIGYYNPAGNSSVLPGVFGLIAPTTEGTVSSIAVATTNVYTRMRRLGIQSTGANSSQVSLFNAAVQYTTGNGNRAGGFFVAMRFGIQDTAQSSTGAAFAGMQSITTPPVINTNFGNTTHTNTFGVVQMTSIANFQMFCNGTSTTPANVVDLGASFPARTTNQGYELTMFSPSVSTGTVAMTLYNINTDTYTTKVYTGASSAVPNFDQFISFRVVKNSFSVSTAPVGIGIVSIYTETDN
jgi:hypothetical protein